MSNSMRYYSTPAAEFLTVVNVQTVGRRRKPFRRIRRRFV